MTPAEYVQGLRDLADWIEAHPDEVKESDLSELGYINLYRSSPEEFAQTARALGGYRTKKGDDSYMRISRMFGPVEVYAFIGRERVCRRVVTGTRTVVSEVRDPELAEKALAAVPLVKQEREEEIVEWVCDESIFDPTPDAVKAVAS